MQRSLACSSWLALVALASGVACARPLDRPLEGAPPSRVGETPSLAVDAPPTVSAPLPTVGPSPPPIVIVLPVASASPSPSPAVVARDPILSGLLPPPNANVPPGPVNIGARISASTDLEEVALTLNGESVQPQITAQNPRVWIIAYTSRLAVGKQEVRLNARDRDGRAGGYRWQFEVQPRSVPSPAILPVRTPRPANRP